MTIVQRPLPSDNNDIVGTATERAHAQTSDDQTDTGAAARLLLLSSVSEASDAVKG